MLNIVVFWNIQGLCSKTFGLKSTNTDFLNSITNVDILILTETWCRSDVSTQCPASYSEIIVPSWKLNSIHRGRDSGGLVIWIKNDLAPYTSPVQQGKNHIWFKLDKSFGILDKDLLSVDFIFLHQIPHTTTTKYLTLYRKKLIDIKLWGKFYYVEI